MQASQEELVQIPWWREAVVYQIYPRSFADTNGDGVGDLAGIMAHLEYLSSTLGIDAIWISPFYRSPMRDFGYDVSNHTDVDPLFGTLADAEELIGAVHAHGMKIILDYVSNHTSIDHAWFQESRSSRDNPKREWYVWKDPAPDGGPPNNWLSAFGGPAWTLDEHTGQYFLHSFLRSMPDVNWHHEPLAEAMHGVLRFWLDRGVDGFRIDAAHYVGKDPQFRDNPPATSADRHMHKPVGEYGTQSHLYDKGDPFTHEVYQGIRRLLEEYSEVGQERLLIGEMHLYDWSEWASYFGPNLDEFHLPFNFGMLIADWNASDVQDLVGEIETATPEGGWPNWVAGNHDESRIASRIGVEQARPMMALILTLRGTPTIYYGDELGFVDAVVPPERRQDPWGLQVPDVDVGRDPQRSPMLWTAEQHGGFSLPGVEPWLPTIDPARYSVAAQLGQDASMLELTRRLLQVRKQRRSLRLGDYAGLEDMPDGCFGFERAIDGERTVVLASFSDDELSVSLPEGEDWIVILSTAAGSDRSGEVADYRVQVSAHEVIILGTVE